MASPRQFASLDLTSVNIVNLLSGSRSLHEAEAQSPSEVEVDQINCAVVILLYSSHWFSFELPFDASHDYILLR